MVRARWQQEARDATGAPRPPPRHLSPQSQRPILARRNAPAMTDRMKRMHPTRRTVVKYLVAGGIVASGSAAIAQTKPAATTSTSLPTTQPINLAVSDIEAVDRVLGHAHSSAEREMMRGGL